MAAPLLRLRSDEQLVALVRAGHDEAFRVIHDRYHQRLFAYTRQMLTRSQDAEDVLQDVFVRVYTSLRASDRKVDRLRPWLYRAAHNRCVDELRRPALPSTEVMEDIRSPDHDPIAHVIEREAFASVLQDIGRLPVQQRSALLLRELGGAHYADIALALGTTVPAVKSLLVRARMTLACSLEARNTGCSAIREELTLAHDRGVRPDATARAHLRDCAGCQGFRHELRGTSRQLRGLVPALGPMGVLANALGLGGTGSGASAGGGAALSGGGSAIGGGAFASAGVLSGGHVATLVAAAVATAGGAVAVQDVVTPSRPSASALVQGLPSAAADAAPGAAASPASESPAPAPVSAAPPVVLPPASSATTPPDPGTDSAGTVTGTGASAPPAPGLPAPAAAGSASPLRQPAITGIDAVSTSKPVPASALGHTSITGTEQVSAAKPSTSGQSATGSSATAGTGTSASGSSTDATDGTSSSTGSGSESSATGSTQTSSSGSTTDSTQTSSSSSTTWGTTGIPAAQ